MSATSPLGAAGAVAIALLTVSLLQPWFGPPPPLRRFSALDGLRGYAAFLVYVHHASLWYVFNRTGLWVLPATRLYLHFGQSSVGVFFMITGFLFWTKLIDGRSRPIDWRRLYRSRVLRLVPLFLVFVALLWALALATTGLRLRVSAARAALQTLQWLTFTIAGMPDLNRAPTAIIGGAAWSLPYEWWFYLALPMAALLLRLRPAAAWLALGAAGAAGGVWWVSSSGSWLVASTFLGGIASAFVVRQPGLRAWACGRVATVLCLAALAALTRFQTTFALLPLLLLSTAFAVIACGNTLFGALSWPAARRLGEIGYSVYLLHGLVLYAIFDLVLGPERAAALSFTGHWLVVYACVPLVVGLSCATFRAIEAPAMAAVDRIRPRR